MARRRMSDYGTAKMPPMRPGNVFPLPPPPDGKPPVRLPFGVSAEQPPEQAAPVQQEPEGQDAILIRLLQSMGKL